AAGNTFTPITGQPWEGDFEQEDLGAVFFDADSDGDQDLYVVSGGNAFEPEDPALQDRLYLNDGNGQFTKATDALPEMLTSGGCVAVADYDQDGDQDLFVGGRVVPGKYPFAPRSYLLRNEGGRFVDVTADLAPELVNPGLVTAATWTDFNSDGRPDLLVTGEWMALLFMENDGQGFADVAESRGLTDTEGWWFSLAAADVDGDGDQDYIAGNLGLNYKYQASAEEPFDIYCHDFDGNGSLDIVLGFRDEGELFPLRGRECSSDQMPFIKEKFPDYESFGKATLIDVYEDQQLSDALHYQARTFESAVLRNDGNGQFALEALPKVAQRSAVNGIVPLDLDEDQAAELLL
ncbi:MAG: VCBS repeat-containing protein, partial [Bacteroidota bacterium]